MSKCSECGNATTGKATRFCGRPCKDAWNNRQKRRGVILLNLFAETRYNRSGSYGIADVNGLMATWRSEDVAAGRVTHHPEMIPCAIVRGKVCR